MWHSTGGPVQVTRNSQGQYFVQFYDGDVHTCGWAVQPYNGTFTVDIDTPIPNGAYTYTSVRLKSTITGALADGYFAVTVSC